ncbi:mitochondrial assembly of ribosomal large subunit protein 1 [Sitophilus oryzae]|uniref:Mitochondrial assembly of ribosomal large subunit protein 1 n=1 Tax=Sitophilus oryzae TaxID=7048 RepID=A0A6J2XBB8_SITOR|nr:mitochondrial assembly of ribosomal large subunit protein 1 [Sitophilus oryzae]
MFSVLHIPKNSGRFVRLFKKRNYDVYNFVKCKFSRSLSNYKEKSIDLYQDNEDPETEVVLDLKKEKYLSDLEETNGNKSEKLLGLNLERGIYGVYDIEDLVDTLHKENAEDLFVAAVPKEINYVDYIVLVSGKSVRHMQAIAQFVRRVYKHKKLSTDIFPRLEGEDSKDWIAIDLGNIALHIFSHKARKLYDLDLLWSVGPKYDDEYNKKEPVSEILEKYSTHLGGFQPAS